MKNEVYNFTLKTFSILVYVFGPLVLMGIFDTIVFSMFMVRIDSGLLLSLVGGMTFVSMSGGGIALLLSGDHIFKPFEKYN